MTRLLIVDDNERNLYMLQVLMKGHGYQVVSAGDGAEALEKARRNPPDVIIADILMPVMDGFTLCREWKKDPQLQDIPFVFYTATYTDPKDEEFALRLGAARFIVRPAEPDVFAETLREVIREAQEGRLAAPREPIEEEPVYLKGYSERLVKKLEDKMLQLERANRRLTVLHQVGAGLASVKPLGELALHALHTVVEAMGYTNATFFAFDEEKQELRLLGAVGFSDELLATFRRELVFSLGEARGLVGLVGQTREPLIVADTTSDPRWITLDETIRSALLVPVVYEGYLLGVANFFSTEAGAFDEEEARDLMMLANNMAIAIENAWLFEQAQQEIAERKQAEEVLAKERNLLRTLIDNLPDYIYVKDTESRFVTCNVAVARLIGAPTLDELVGKTDFDFYPQELAARYYADEQEIIRSGQPLINREEPLMDRVSNRRGWLLTTKVPLQDSDGKTVGLVGIGRDITDHRRAEEELQRNYQIQTVLNALLHISLIDISLEDQLELILDHVLSIPWLTFESKGSFFLVEGDPEVLVMKAQNGLAEPIQKACVRVPFGRCLCGQAALTREIQFADCLDDRHKISYEGIPPHGHYCVPIIYAGRVLGVINMYLREGHRRDQREEEFLATVANTVAGIIMRKWAEEELRRVNRALKVLSECNQAVVRAREESGLLHDVCRIIVQVGGYCLAWVGLAEQDEEKTVRPVALAGYEQGYLDTLKITWADTERGRGPTGTAIRTGKPSINKNVLTNPDYAPWRAEAIERGYQSSIALPLIADDRTVGALNIYAVEPDGFDTEEVRLLTELANDLAYGITALRTRAERQRAEAALKEERATLARRVAERTAELSAANAELARAARLKDEFLASMSHELRTPLNAILGLSEALQEEVYGPLTERQGQSLHTIEESGRHLLDLINDILDLSKIEAGKVDLKLGTVSVGSVGQASMQMVRQLAHEKRLKVASSFDSAVTTIQADERRLKQILVNLLNNAVKFTPEGGEVGLEVVGDVEGEAVHFTVWDTGVGIAPEDIERLSHPFVQLDSSLSRQHAGTGLGLALVSRLAELHGGGVSLESKVGKGSRFTVSLPWRAAAEAVEPVEEEEPAEAEAPGVPALRQALIVEDSASAAEQLTRYMGELGVETVVHPRGEGTVGQVLAVQPDVMILDIILPDLSGWDVLAQLKAEPRTREIPVLIVSVVDERSRGLALGAAEYLVKPISRQRLQRALAKILPRQVEEAKALVVASDQEPGTEQPLILLAEDNEVNIKTISDYLLFKGYRVTVARNGFEALERAREERPDLILMDIQMPGMDGLEATRRIRADADPSTGLRTSLAAVPIIALTALAMPGDRERCLKAGANEYLSKPVNWKQLINLIEAQLSAGTRA